MCDHRVFLSCVKICAIQTNMAFIVFCILFVSANCAAEADTETTTVYTTLPGAELQSLMSYMMSKITPNATQDLLGGQTEGITDEPNLGYGPYWTNLVDIPLEQKCKRCSKLFRNYTVVCAVDGTGNMYVNISMCAMLRQNCLAGIAYGQTTGNHLDFNGDMFVVQDGWAKLSIMEEQDVTILLSHTPELVPPYYMIVLDGWGARVSKLYRDDNYWPDTWYTNMFHTERALGNPSEYIEFVIRWNTTSGWILITKSSYTNWTEGFFLNWTDPDPFTIKYMGISSTDGRVGYWIVEDFVVSNIGPCADTPVGGAAMPREMPTNPTAIPPIIENYSTFNKGYYKRLKDAGFDAARQAYSTREEY